MNKLKRIIFLATIIVSMLLAGCGAKISDSTGNEKLKTGASDQNNDKWTILVYLCGTDLESRFGSATDDIFEMMAADIDDNINVIIETGGAKEWWNTTVKSGQIGRYQLYNNDLLELEILDDSDMGDPKTLEDFISYGIENYPADKTGLILWDHGGGSISGVCFDETHDYNYISLRELDTSIKNAIDNKDFKFEFIGFDACLMSTLETANILVPYANFMYASEETEPGSGWDYTTILNYLAKNHDVDGAKFGKIQSKAYYNSADGNEPGSSVTFSITDLSKVNDLCKALDKTAEEILNNKDAHKKIIKACRNSDNFGGNNRREGYSNMIDIGDMLKNIIPYVPSAEETLRILNEAVVCNIRSEQHYNSHGLSMFYPYKVDTESQTLPVFHDICPSAYYIELANTIAYDMEEQTLSGIYGFLDDKSCTIQVVDAYLDSNGSLTVEIDKDDENFNFASGIIYWEYYLDDNKEEWWDIYLGEDDDIQYDEETKTLTDHFQGYWITLEDQLLPIDIVSRYDTKTEYNSTILLNGEETSLHLIYDWDKFEFSILGTWDGINPETGMAYRDTVPLKTGDEIILLYYYIDENDEWQYFEGEPIIVKDTQDNLNLEYEKLFDGDFDYALNLYDIYGNSWRTEFVHFGIDTDGSVFFYHY